MRRTFTLRRLFINLTVLCVALGFIARFPGFSVEAGLWILLVAPTLAACALLFHFSTRPVTTVGAAVFGALVAAVFCPSSTICSPISWWDLYVIRFGSMAIPTATGAVVLGSLILLLEHKPRWRWPWRSRPKVLERLDLFENDGGATVPASTRNANNQPSFLSPSPRGCT